MIPAGTVTPVVPNSGTYVKDLGVTDAAKAIPLVASAPTTGQYSVDAATGAYTFAAADAGKTVFINFRYSAMVAGAKSITVSNLDMGYTPEFAVDLQRDYKGKFMHMNFFRCTSNKLDSVQNRTITIFLSLNSSLWLMILTAFSKSIYRSNARCNLSKLITHVVIVKKLLVRLGFCSSSIGYT